MYFNVMKMVDFDVFVENILKKEKIEKDFFFTATFRENFEILKLYLENNDFFSTDGAYYTETPEEQIFANNAIQIFNCVYHHVTPKKEDSDEWFPSETISYEDVDMRIISGQGSIYKFWLNREE